MASNSTEHVEEYQLDTDILYRFNYVTKFIGFDNEDVKAILESKDLVAPAVPIIVDAVYEKLFKFDITKRFFVKRNAGFEGKLDEFEELSDKNSEQIKFRKDMLSRYLVKLVTADYSDPNFVKYLDWVGKIHTDKAGSKSINVDYIHVNALMGYVSDVVINYIETQLKDDHENRTRTVRAFNKLFWIQNDLFTRHYVNDFANLPHKKQQQGFCHNWLAVAALGTLVGVAGYLIGTRK
ncbi:hypothetical protein ABK040_006086 [Willaertia magna]